MEPEISKNNISNRVREAGPGVNAELGLKRSSINPSLQPAPTMPQLLMVVAAPGPSESAANVVPWQVAMEEDASDVSHERKRLTGSQKRSLLLKQRG